MQLQPAYLAFYFDGRDDALDTEDLDIGKLADKAIAGPATIHEVIVAAVTSLAAPAAYVREKREWVQDAKEVITEAGGDEEAAWSHFQAGRIDEAVMDLEPEVLEVMDPREEEFIEKTGGEGEDDEDDEDGDQDDDEEDGDDEDEAG